MSEYATFNNSELISHLANFPEDKEAWDEFFYRFSRHIDYVAWKLFVEYGNGKKSHQSAASAKDLVQDIYINLLQNDCKALRSYKGKSENAIFRYLETIAHNVYRNQIEASLAEKRGAITVPISSGNHDMHPNDFMPPENYLESTTYDTESYIDFIALRDEVEEIIGRYTGCYNSERDRLIFRMAIFAGLKAKEISTALPFDLTPKRIGNIIAELKNHVRIELEKRKKI